MIKTRQLNAGGEMFSPAPCPQVRWGAHKALLWHLEGTAPAWGNSRTWIGSKTLKRCDPAEATANSRMKNVCIVFIRNELMQPICSICKQCVREVTVLHTSAGEGNNGELGEMMRSIQKDTGHHTYGVSCTKARLFVFQHTAPKTINGSGRWNCPWSAFK